jgi:hypothetical protein
VFYRKNSDRFEILKQSPLEMDWEVIFIPLERMEGSNFMGIIWGKISIDPICPGESSIF